jgi:translation initiation factor IF-1
LARDDLIPAEGTIIDKQPNASFKVQLQNSDQVVLAAVSGKMRKNRIRILVGDRVSVEMSPYDLSRGRITYRYTPDRSVTNSTEVPLAEKLADLTVGAEAVTRHDTTKAVLRSEPDELLAGMQTEKSRKGMEVAFKASPVQLGRAAVKGARGNSQAEAIPSHRNARKAQAKAAPSRRNPK